MIPYARQRVYDPKSKNVFKISRTKLENFVRCQRCFYLDLRHGIGQPGGFPFNLNSAVDHLLKKEFDIHRAKGQAHPLMKKYGIDAVPFAHKDLDRWRENFYGVQYHHEPTNFLVFGAVDDVWINNKGELHVVDYKATSKNGDITIDADWQNSYKRQMEIYQWLLRRNGFPVAERGYFVYCNGRKDLEAFDARLEFDVVIIPYDGDDQWVEVTIKKAHQLLQKNQLPKAAAACDFCSYRQAAAAVE